MIICPNCNKEIDSDSHYCDQCGQHLLYCSSCGHVGTGKRCILCGGQMCTADDCRKDKDEVVPTVLVLSNMQGINIKGQNGALIGRREGPYSSMFEQNRFVSGLHAQLTYKAHAGWMITDKHSSNGTKVNNVMLQPDVASPLKDGDTLTIANINLTVSIK